MAAPTIAVHPLLEHVARVLVFGKGSYLNFTTS